MIFQGEFAMKTLSTVAILATAAGIVSSPAFAAPTINFSLQTNQFNKPTMEFKFQGGKYVWEQQPINTQFSASANTNNNDLIWEGLLYVVSLGVGGNASFTGKVPTGAKTWSQQGPITFPANFLNAYQSNFASFCDSNGGAKLVVKGGLSITFAVRQGFMKKHKIGDPPPPEVTEDDVGPPSSNFAHRTVNMPVTVVCGAKPAGAQPRPGGIAVDKGSFKVQSIALSFGGAPTSRPNPATVCKQAKLTVRVQANQAGAVKFRLNKKIGNGPTQNKVVDAWASFDGKGFFFANYQETVTVNGTTNVQAMAEDLINPIGLTTPWKDVTLHCTGAGGGGLAGTPNTSNPDNQLPNKPPVPKRVFDGPSGLTPGAKPTHAPAQATIVPQTKTAPAAPKRLAPLKANSR
jgi:hypothetical protein